MVPKPSPYRLEIQPPKVSQQFVSVHTNVSYLLCVLANPQEFILTFFLAGRAQREAEIRDRDQAGEAHRRANLFLNGGCVYLSALPT